MSREQILAHRLAYQWGYHDPDQLLDEMPASLWRRWLHWQQCDPMLQDRLDWLFASTKCVLAQVHVGKKGKKLKPAMFLTKWGPKERRARSVDEIAKRMKLWVASMGGKINGKSVKGGGS